MRDENIVTEQEWAAWEGERAAAGKAYDNERRNAAKRAQPRTIEALTEQVEGLETDLWIARECLSASLTLLSETRQQLAFERDVTRGLLLELPAEPYLKAA